LFSVSVLGDCAGEQRQAVSASASQTRLAHVRLAASLAPDLQSSKPVCLSVCLSGGLSIICIVMYRMAAAERPVQRKPMPLLPIPLLTFAPVAAGPTSRHVTSRHRGVPQGCATGVCHRCVTGVRHVCATGLYLFVSLSHCLSVSMHRVSVSGCVTGESPAPSACPSPAPSPSPSLSPPGCRTHGK
jgi:hypothetical protein